MESISLEAGIQGTNANPSLKHLRIFATTGNNKKINVTLRVNILSISVCDQSSQGSDGHPDIHKIRAGLIPPEAELRRVIC